MRLLAAAALCALLIPLRAGAQQPFWQVVEGLGGVFTVMMPAVPVYSAQTAKSSGGTEFVLHSWTLDQDGRTFLVQTATYPADVDVTDPKSSLTRSYETTARNLQSGKWDSITWTSLQGQPAVELIGRINLLLGMRSLQVMKGRQIYAFIYAGPPESVNGADANRFFGALHIK